MKVFGSIKLDITLMFQFPKLIDKIRVNLGHKLLRVILGRKSRFATKTLATLFSILNYGVYEVRHESLNHHFVPQFILKNFKIGDAGLIYEYNSDYPKGRERSIRKHVCMVKDLYTFRDRTSKEPNDFIETHLFANYLDGYAPKIVELIREDKKTTGAEEAILATFVAFQYVTTPKFMGQLNEFVTFLVKARGVPLSHITDRNNFKTFFRQAFVENVYSITRKEFEAFRATNKLLMTGAENLLISLAIQAGQQLSKPLHLTKDAVTAKTEDDLFFITDHPVIIVNLKNGEFMGPLLWEFDDMTVFMPLSPTRAIHYFSRTTPINPGYKFWEMATLANAYRNVYSNRQSPVLEIAFGVKIKR